MMVSCLITSHLNNFVQSNTKGNVIEYQTTDTEFSTQEHQFI